MNLYRNIKYFIQRGKRGYADCDVWDLDLYLAKVISGSVNRLKEIHHGGPYELFDESAEGRETWKWEGVLDQIVEGFQILHSCGYDGPDGKGFNADNQKKVDTAFTLLRKYWGSLWD